MITFAANAQDMNLHRQGISTADSAGAWAAPIRDGAGGHQPGKRLALAGNIVLALAALFSGVSRRSLTRWKMSEFIRASTSCAPRLGHLRRDPAGLAERLIVSDH